MRIASAGYPEAPVALSAQLGWVSFLVLVAIGLWAWARGETVRRALLAEEDPRIYAIMRVGLAAVTFQTFWNMRALWHLLWSDEGMFTLSEARQRFGGAALPGWTEVDGFLDARAVWTFWTHKHSLLFFQASPDFVDGYLYLLFAVLLAYAIGLRTRVMGLVAWAMILGLYNHNSVYLEGTDTVIKAVWFPMLFARADAAWSVDAWIRRRAVAASRAGRFATWVFVDRAASWVVLGAFVSLAWHLCGLPLGAGVAVGLGGATAALARSSLERRGGAAAGACASLPAAAPCWPRLLIAAQVTAVYVTTGLVKVGSVWARGDALYYALSMDHFYRFEGPTQWFAAVFGTNLFRYATWIVHSWEIGFPLVLLGLWLRFELRAEEEPWRVGETLGPPPWRRYLAIGALLFGYAAAYWFTVRSVPYLQPLPKDGPPRDPSAALRSVHLVFAVVIPLLVAGWLALARWPIRLRVGERRLVIDRRAVREWLLGRRIWLGIGVLFHGALIVSMNIGTFPFIMLWTYLAFFEAGELLDPARQLAQRWHGEDGALPRLLAASPASGVALGGATCQTPTSDPIGWWRACVRGRPPTAVGGRLPDAVVLVLGAAGVVVALLGTGQLERVAEALGMSVDEEGVPQSWSRLVLGWSGLCLLAGALAGLRPRDLRDGPEGRRRGPALQPGALGRTAAMLLLGVHVLCVAAYLLPAYPAYDQWRKPAKIRLTPWLDATGTRQSWRMFAPNPPRSNTFMLTHVVDQDGEVTNLGLDAWTDRPRVFLRNDRVRKMNRRMVGKDKWYLEHWGRAHCRSWALRHDGVAPREVRILKLMTDIPSPEEARARGPIDPREAKVRRHTIKTIPCDRALTPDFLRRHGYPLDEYDLDEEELRADAARRRSEARRERWLQGT